MTTSHSHRTPRIKAFRLVCSAAVLFIAAACAPGSSAVLTSAAAPYRPVRITADIPSRPGALAWSPDGSQLAFIGRTVTVIDADGEPAASRHIDIPAPRFLAWAGDGSLYVLAREGDRDLLFAVDPARPGMTRTPLDRRADAVYPIDHRSAFLLSLHASRLRIGTEVRCALSLLTIASGPATTLHAYSRIIPAADIEEDLLFAWSHAGPNPLDGSFLIMEHIKPPALAPYTLVKALDPATGDLMDIGGLDRRTLYSSAGWSPDGRRIALTDFNGNISIRGADEKAFFDGPVLGRYPSWHPAGDLLIAGGMLISTLTGESTPLITNGGGSFAQWSPDGKRLAVIARGELALLRNFPDVARHPLDRELKKKLTTLQELLRGGLITAEDYRARRFRLLQHKEGSPQ